jgi:transposase-like protein
MAHIHSVYDTEPHFQIDKTSREVKNVSASKTTITQFDHNSERFTFEIPRFIDGHDMSLCNVVQVHYINIDSTDKTNKIVGVYTVDDLQLSPEDEDIVICSWLISQNATQLAGPLTFLLRYTCSNDGVLDYAWNTARCTSITVSNGLYNGEAIIEEYSDILAVWEQKIVSDVTDGIDKAIEEKVDNVKIVETATGSAITIDSSEAPIPCLKLLGKTTQDGTPTPTEPKEIKSVGDSGSFEVVVYGKNVLVNTATTTTTNGVTCTVNADKSITTSGTNTLSHSYRFTIGSFELPKGDYILTGNNSNGQNDYMLLQRGNGTLTQQWNGKEVEFSVTETETITVYYVVSTNATVSNTIYPMIRLATETDSTYEPYTKQSITFTDTLRGVGDIADEKDFARGVKTEHIYSIIINSMNGVSFSEYMNTTRISVSAPKALAGGIGMCNRLKVSSMPLSANSEDNCISCYRGGDVYFRCDAFANATDKKTWISEHPIHFIYPLAEPIETPISESELNAYRHLMTNKGTTTVLSECDVEMLYYVNKPNAQAIGDIHTQINKDYFKTLSLIAENVATVEETESESEE